MRSSHQKGAIMNTVTLNPQSFPMWDNLEVTRFIGNESASSSHTSRFTPQILSLDTSQLSINQEYTYKELCTLLNQPVKYGNAKTRHLLEFSRFFEYEKIKTKYKITEIYNPPIPYIPVIQDSHKYNADMINVILAYLYSTGKEVLYFSYMDFILICGLANELYRRYGKEYSELSKKYNIDIKQIGDFYSTSYQTFKRIINSALESMQKRNIIECINTYVISERINNSKTNPITRLREVTNEEYLSLMVIQDEVLEELHLSSKNELWYKPDLRYKYNDLFLKHVHEKQPYWEACFKTIKILSPAPLIRKAVDSDEIRKQLNTKVFKVLHDKTVKQYTDLLINSPDQAASWLTDQSTLEETLIRLMA